MKPSVDASMAVNRETGSCRGLRGSPLEEVAGRSGGRREGAGRVPSATSGATWGDMLGRQSRVRTFTVTQLQRGSRKASSSCAYFAYALFSYRLIPSPLPAFAPWSDKHVSMFPLANAHSLAVFHRLCRPQTPPRSSPLHSTSTRLSTVYRSRVYAFPLQVSTRIRSSNYGM